MYDGMPYDPIQHQGQGHESLRVTVPSIFEIYLRRHLQWELANDHWLFKLGHSIYIWSGHIFDICRSCLCHVTLNLEENYVPYKNLITNSSQNSYVGKGLWVMLDGMSFDLIQKSRWRPLSKICTQEESTVSPARD